MTWKRCIFPCCFITCTKLFYFGYYSSLRQNKLFYFTLLCCLELMTHICHITFTIFFMVTANWDHAWKIVKNNFVLMNTQGLVKFDYCDRNHEQNTNYTKSHKPSFGFYLFVHYLRKEFVINKLNVESFWVTQGDWFFITLGTCG